jgi:hypothetical protein
MAAVAVMAVMFLGNLDLSELPRIQPLSQSAKQSATKPSVLASSCLPHLRQQNREVSRGKCRMSFRDTKNGQRRSSAVGRPRPH